MVSSGLNLCMVLMRDPLLHEMPLLKLLHAALPSRQQPESVLDILLALDEIVTNTVAIDVTPATEPDVGPAWIPGSVGERVTGPIDDRWLCFAACLSDKLPKHNRHWNIRCDDVNRLRRPTQAHWDAFQALDVELALLWQVAREQSYASTIEQRAQARRCTTDTIIALSESTQGRLTTRECQALHCNADALSTALHRQSSRLSALKAEEKRFRRTRLRRTRILRVRRGLIELQEEYAKLVYLEM